MSRIYKTDSEITNYIGMWGQVYSFPKSDLHFDRREVSQRSGYHILKR